jgi:hypothetical protein
MLSINSLLTAIVTAPSLALVTLALSAVPGQAVNAEIKCNTNGNIPTVVAQNQQKQVTILQFSPKYFDSQAALTNCQNTAQTLQDRIQQDRVGYLTGDVIEGKSVFCTVNRRGKSCESAQAEILFIIAANSSPNQVLYDMLGSQLKPSEPIHSRTISRIYTKIDRYWWGFWKF